MGVEVCEQGTHVSSTLFLRDTLYAPSQTPCPLDPTTPEEQTTGHSGPRTSDAPKSSLSTVTGTWSDVDGDSARHAPRLLYLFP